VRFQGGEPIKIARAEPYSAEATVPPDPPIR
jgi:hypothetical protein